MTIIIQKVLDILRQSPEKTTKIGTLQKNYPDLKDHNIRLAKINKQRMLEAKEIVLEEKIAMRQLLA